MPVGAGVMQMPRVTVVRTATEITSISPSITSVVCGDSIEIFFSVSSYDELLTVNDGYVTIIDLNTTVKNSNLIYSCVIGVSFFHIVNSLYQENR